MKTIRHYIFNWQATSLCLAAFLAIPSTTCFAQDNTRNYVKTRLYVKEDTNEGLDNVQYVDGLGRPVQNVQIHVTPNKNNLADRIEYDVMGRKSKIWLPIPTMADYVETANMYNDYMGVYHEDTAPFELRTYESWQKGRKTANIGPGQAWAEHPSISSFHTNKSSGVLACKKYTVNETTGALKEEGFFPSNQLLVQKLTDEDRNEKYVFADAEGRQLLVRRVDGNTYSDVYFVHDLRGNIRYVLQPMYQKQPSIDKFAFRYLYDEANRCIEKQLPGCEKTAYAYDAADRMVMSQTGNQRRTGHKTFYRYDALGRNTYVVERAVGNDSLVTIRKFYDDYSFLKQQGFNSPCFKVSAQRAQGLLTGREVAVYGCDSLLREVNLYDRKGRLTRQIRTNMRGGYDDTSYEYSFTDKPVSKLMVHSTANMPTLTQRYEYEYDHADRLKKVTYCLNNAEKKTLREVYYDELGRVGYETTGDIPELGQVINYNIRSYPISRYSPLLEERICYEDATQVFMESVTPCYNGNICAYSSSVGKPQRGYLWGICNITRSFSYCYDGLSRLKRVKYKDSDSPDHNYNTNYEYDLQGNLLKLQRNGLCDYDTYEPIDCISMEYDGNQLHKATDPCTDPAFPNALYFADGADQPEEYTYDANGNMTADLNKHIRKISYNTQNLPQEVRFDDGSSIAYLYDADGNKLRTSYAIASYSESMPITQVMHGNVSSQTQQPYMARNSIDYCGSAVYENGKLAYVPIDGGYITFADSTATSAPTFHYYVKDYLGNNRLVVRDDGFGEQMNHYYPFGALMSVSTQGAAQRYKYNGKELDRIHGLNLYDYGARQYDAALGRWTSIDPLAEKYYEISPYAYCANNPVINIDLDGKETYVALNSDGTYRVIGGTLNTDRNIYLYSRPAKGGPMVRGKSIGLSTSTTSFYDSDKQAWAIGSTINPKDRSGESFLSYIIKKRPPLFNDYMINARNSGLYDFKISNGTTTKADDGNNIYRGMPIGFTASGKTLYTSARDVGNIAAGYIAAINGMTWEASRLAFDGYQSLTSNEMEIEGVSTRNAEYYGWRLGYQQTYNQKFDNFMGSLWNGIKAMGNKLFDWAKSAF